MDALPKHYQELVRDRINALSADPRPHGCKKLQKLQGQAAYRVRQGPYRILYEIAAARLVIVSDIRARREAYP
ncbi:MAG: type II toxin-antitoxin system RelE/ParE family toxin [Pseudomonadota bacterium]